MGCIYKIENTVNGKAYIGLTVGTAEERFKKHVSMIYSSGCSALYSAMLKYGVDKFKVETIVECHDRDDLMNLEALYIEKLGTLAPCGYNLTTGGENCKASKATREKISASLKGRTITWGGKVSKSIKKLWTDDNYRAKQIEQRKKKRGKYKEGIKKPLRINLPIDEINKMHESGLSINKIAIYFGVPHSTIKRRIK